LIAALAKAGFAVVRIWGSREIIGPGLLHKILRDSQWSVDEIRKLL
jgi:predicted RNA binding protein YcfA (HicA-like mRNA interferase family)